MPSQAKPFMGTQPKPTGTKEIHAQESIIPYRGYMNSPLKLLPSDLKGEFHYFINGYKILINHLDMALLVDRLQDRPLVSHKSPVHIIVDYSNQGSSVHQELQVLASCPDSLPLSF